MNDDERVKRAQGGDKAAFAGLVAAHGRFLESLTARYVGERDACDAAQEIWVAVYRKLWQLSNETKFVAWLRRVAYYECLNYRKARSRGRWQVSLDFDTWQALAESVADPLAGVEDLAGRAELRAVISRHLDRLPGDYGLLLRLRYLREMSVSEIAEFAQLPYAAVKARLYQGRQLLKGRLADILDGTGRGNRSERDR